MLTIEGKFTKAREIAEAEEDIGFKVDAVRIQGTTEADAEGEEVARG